MLDVNELTYGWDEKPLFTNLSFTLKEGEMSVIRGANGSGKSTLLRLVAGLLPPLSGKITRSQELLYIGHRLALYKEATLNEQLRLWPHVSKEIIDKSLNLWNIERSFNFKISEFSEGQQKRISLLRLSLFPKKLWILDEPHAGLDIEGKATLHKCMETHLTEGGSIVLATHEDMDASSKEITL
jgi:heme exporter protein A